VHVIDREGLDALIRHLSAEGRTVLGPTVAGGAIALGEVGSARDLPEGWTDEQEGGAYRLRRREDRALFGYAVGPRSWKAWLHPAELRLWRARRTDRGFELGPDDAPVPRYAFLGVRPCELHAIRIQERVLAGGVHADPGYRARREAAFLVAVNCGEPGGTCFCASMGTGPAADDGYDLVLTEILDPRDPGGPTRFTVLAGSARGEEALGGVPAREASPGEARAARSVVEEAASRMGRSLDAAGLPELLADRLEHPRWEETAERCLACGNCTLVCPTCFCTSVDDTTELTGDAAERWRRWDSCFATDFSHIHGGSVRGSRASRYRQWLTHKLGTWHEQFGTSGCVGCGRCITWCPVGIDLTEEVAALRRSPGPAAGPDGAARPPTSGGDP